MKYLNPRSMLTVAIVLAFCVAAYSLSSSHYAEASCSFDVVMHPESACQAGPAHYPCPDCLTNGMQQQGNEYSQADVYSVGSGIDDKAYSPVDECYREITCTQGIPSLDADCDFFAVAQLWACDKPDTDFIACADWQRSTDDWEWIASYELVLCAPSPSE